MRALFFVISTVFILVSCQNSTQEQKRAIAEKYNVYGDTILVSGDIAMVDINELYNNLPEGDTVSTVLTAKVRDVCKKKGCWMKLDVQGDKEVMVRFKDYGFFVPKDIVGKQVVLGGNAFVDHVSVDDQQHYAMDAGKSEEEIAAITEPKNTYTFEAVGVLLQK